MVAQSIIPKCLLPLNSIRLGRFILNTQYPQQDSIDPPSSPPPPEQITTLSLDNWQEILTSSRASQLRNRLTSLLKFNVSNSSKNHTSLSALKATTYTLENSKNWFNQGIKSPDIRKWIEAAIEEGATGVYLIVGYHTLSDAKYEKVLVSGGGFGMDLAVPIGAGIAGGNLISTGGADLTGGIGVDVNAEQRQQSGFDIPGEQIYAVQYRKLKFKWYSSRSLKNGVLEKDNRWKLYWDVRGDNEEQDDVLELVFADELGEGKNESDGEESGYEESDEEEELQTGNVNAYTTEDDGVEYLF